MVNLVLGMALAALVQFKWAHLPHGLKLLVGIYIALPLKLTAHCGAGGLTVLADLVLAIQSIALALSKLDYQQHG